jgi:hypothetical protein
MHSPDSRKLGVLKAILKLSTEINSISSFVVLHGVILIVVTELVFFDDGIEQALRRKTN